MISHIICYHFDANLCFASHNKFFTGYFFHLSCHFIDLKYKATKQTGQKKGALKF